MSDVLMVWLNERGQTWQGILMHSDTVTIYCPNYLCQAPNPESHRFCQQCRTLLPKLYLLAVGKGVESLRSGELLAERYAVKQDGVVLDTQPGLLPDVPDDIPSSIDPYLRLSPYQLHVPQVYSVLPASQKRGDGVVLLEQAPIYSEGVGREVTAIEPGAADVRRSDAPSPLESHLTPLEGQLMPALTTIWKQSPALRQLNWLWQIAHLWEPLAHEGVATTLLTPDLLCAEGGLLRLLALKFDGQNRATLADLGRLWQQWQPTANPAIVDVLGQLCQLMQQGQIRNGEQLITLLDRALVVCGQTQSRHIHMATITDQGPSRQRNEDACYPPSGTVWSNVDPNQTSPLVVVCDGIGGHEGGDVASGLAIDTLQQQLQLIPLPERAPDPTVLMLQLEQAALAANDVISQRNDREQRQERQRMGTTLVMALPYRHELYLSHVGDSRIYRITRVGCHQVTLDDDLASREVRLGYALYREALQQPGSGSLVQALGMSASTMLHPTVQRFVVDEDCLFLLCSDGLSDNDRVDEHWHELVPVLEGSLDVATASQRLLAIANTQNGHDNVTIGLIHCQVTQAAVATRPLQIALDVPDLGVAQPSPTSAASQPPATLKTRIVTTRRSSRNPFLALLVFVMLLGLGSVFAYVLLPPFRSWTDSLLGLQSTPDPEIAASVPSPSPSDVPLPDPPEALNVGALIQVKRAPTGTPVGNSVAGAANPLLLWSQPELQTLPKSARVGLGSIPVGSVLQILSRQSIPDRGYWLKLKVCSMPPADVASPPVLASPHVSSTPAADAGSPVVSESPHAGLQPGTAGWIEQTAIAPFVTQNLGLKPAQLGVCTVLPPEPTVSPSPTVKPANGVKERRTGGQGAKGTGG